MALVVSWVSYFRFKPTAAAPPQQGNYLSEVKNTFPALREQAELLQENHKVFARGAEKGLEQELPRPPALQKQPSRACRAQQSKKTIIAVRSEASDKRISMRAKERSPSQCVDLPRVTCSTKRRQKENLALSNAEDFPPGGRRF